MSETVIFHCSGDDGVIEITQERDQRSLYLGTGAKQSSMDLSQPHRLTLSYTRAMMGCLLFHPAPRQVLLIGLGGGSLARFFLHHFRDCSIDAVELRADVVKLAHAYFALPAQSNLEIFTTEASRFLNQGLGRFEHYDLILVDAFNHDGVAHSVKTFEFIQSCRERLSPRGIFTINLWDHPAEEIRHTGALIQQLFENNTLLLPVIDKGNLIIHAARDKRTLQLSASCKLTARRLETELEIDLSGLLRQLKRANRWRSLGRFMGRA